MFRQILSKRLPTPLSSPNGFHMTPSLISDHLDLSFNDHEAAFRSKKTSEIVRGYAVLTLCGFRPLVTHNARLMKFGFIDIFNLVWYHVGKKTKKFHMYIDTPSPFLSCTALGARLGLIETSQWPYKCEWNGKFYGSHDF